MAGVDDILKETVNLLDIGDENNLDFEEREGDVYDGSVKTSRGGFESSYVNDLSTIMRQNMNNPTWQRGALKIGFKTQNPDGLWVYDGGRQDVHHIVEAIDKQISEKAVKNGVEKQQYNSLLTHLRNSYRKHPQIPNEYNLRMFSFDQDLGFYMLDIESCLKFNKIKDSNIESLLETESELDENPVLLESIHEKYRHIKEVSSKYPLIL